MVIFLLLKCFFINLNIKLKLNFPELKYFFFFVKDIYFLNEIYYISFIEYFFLDPFQNFQ
jgi:hypothetical protein